MTDEHFIVDLFEVTIAHNRDLSLAFLEWVFQESKAERLITIRGTSCGPDWATVRFPPEYRPAVDRFFVEHEHLINHQHGDHVSAPDLPPTREEP